ncbi:MAG: hypothetical protein ACE37D_16720 [Pseudomonadales bacterium]
MTMGKVSAAPLLKPRTRQVGTEPVGEHWSVQVVRGLGIGLLIAVGLVVYGASWLPYV